MNSYSTWVNQQFTDGKNITPQDAWCAALKSPEMMKLINTMHSARSVIAELQRQYHKDGESWILPTIDTALQPFKGE